MSEKYYAVKVLLQNCSPTRVTKDQTQEKETRVNVLLQGYLMAGEPCEMRLGALLAR